MNDLRTMVHFPIGDRLFNYRAAAIIIRDGHVLTCQEDDDEYIMLPDGRVELGEASDAALARELAEEVQAPAAIGRLVYTVENFFGHNGKVVHELGAYYAVELSDFPFGSGGVVREIEEDGHQLRFEWLPVTGDALQARGLNPPWMRDRLMRLPLTTEHLIITEPSLLGRQESYA